MSDGPPAAAPDRLSELRSSAQGWHGIQLAALGFIGLCGVIKTGDGTDPWALQVLSGILVLVAFVLACGGVYLVGRAAWPLYGGGREPAPEPEPASPGDVAAIALVSRQITRGLLMTFLSVAALALATATSWWPQDSPDGDESGAAQVLVRTDDGQTACGALGASSQPGTVRVQTGAQQLDVPVDSLASLTPVGGC